MFNKCAMVFKLNIKKTKQKRNNESIFKSKTKHFIYRDVIYRNDEIPS